VVYTGVNEYCRCVEARIDAAADDMRLLRLRCTQGGSVQRLDNDVFRGRAAAGFRERDGGL